MTTSPAQVLQALLANPRDLTNVKSVTTPDVTYVSLSEDNPELKRYLPWTGTNTGPEAMVRAFEGIGRAWETKAFEVRDVIVQDDKVAMFGSFTYLCEARPREARPRGEQDEAAMRGRVPRRQHGVEHRPGGTPRLLHYALHDGNARGREEQQAQQRSKLGYRDG